MDDPDVLIIDDHAVVGEAIAAALRSAGDFGDVRTAATGAEGVRWAVEMRPQVIVVDQRLPDCDGVEVIRVLRNDVPRSTLVMLTASSPDEVLLPAVEAGAAGFLSKTLSLKEVVDGIRRVAGGDVVIPTGTMVSILRRDVRKEAGVIESLTARESEVLALIARGLSNSDIASTLYVSVHTVRNHVANILRKMGVHSKLEAVVAARSRGMVNPFSAAGPSGRSNPF